MKKKQLQKLMKHFRPSMEQTKTQLFRELEKKAMALYQLPIKVYIYRNRKNEMIIEFLGESDKEKTIAVPLDKNFNTVIKRIQNEEEGLFERFSTNLVEEIASYWQRPIVPAAETTANEGKETVEEVKEATKESKEAATEESKEAATEKVAEQKPTEQVAASRATTQEADVLTAEAFIEKISQFPKFKVNETADAFIVVEQAAKEERVLASIDKKVADTFQIENALERKYKLKLEVIPLIEAFAHTAIAKR
ncbi:hypothetical protein [Enterococcus columbae]|uniref:Uncharacterized protein n=1 Tax=Enterococcus columbae DSM 7374 = ATCC 51263 TaxID=1121865 RepID=S1NEV3_9ENTE|nr:hypothetical protein [Enterococcus columbae]EOT42507.1 hypothetical protein OMW_00985 [Enterococcus columbae DSM 7374 = ATCC 51263]EOW87557.1 hypothetical protein I568_00222 [Enterococcus columbae DSM 7374 = ATCC 51263]OJG23111.1 hypothetical protein RR47_GL000601 [Enterococcus columbae DSM 7374 = ATCC 51263]